MPDIHRGSNMLHKIIGETVVDNEYDYNVQCQAPAGNWFDVLGTRSLGTAVNHKEFCEERGDTCRIVTKVVKVLDIDSIEEV